jgi:hypothetical protein
VGNTGMNDIYYDTGNPGSLGGVDRLRRAAHAHKPETEEWLRRERTYTLHKPARKRYNTRPYKTAGIDQQWQADLVEMIPYHRYNNGYKYMLTVIDLFSRYAWALPIKDKTGKILAAAFKKIFAEGRKPQRLQTDAGREFDNRHVQHLLNIENIRFFTVNSQFKAAVVERFNRTLKARMWRYFTRQGNYQWIKVLPSLVTSYNSSVHRSIGMTPRNVTRDVENELWTRQEEKLPQKVTQRDPKPVFRVGDKVRVSKYKSVFEKGYLPNWTEEIFTVSRLLNTRPKQYKVVDVNEEEIRGSFYGAELQKVALPERYAIERVIRRRRVRGRMQYLVKWLGYGPEFNSWVDDLQHIT